MLIKFYSFLRYCVLISMVSQGRLECANGFYILQARKFAKTTKTSKEKKKSKSKRSIFKYKLTFTSFHVIKLLYNAQWFPLNHCLSQILSNNAIISLSIIAAQVEFFIFSGCCILCTRGKTPVRFYAGVGQSKKVYRINWCLVQYIVLHKYIRCTNILLHRVFENKRYIPRVFSCESCKQA